MLHLSSRSLSTCLNLCSTRRGSLCSHKSRLRPLASQVMSIIQPVHGLRPHRPTNTALASCTSFTFDSDFVQLVCRIFVPIIPDTTHLLSESCVRCDEGSPSPTSSCRRPRRLDYRLILIAPICGVLFTCHRTPFSLPRGNDLMLPSPLRRAWHAYLLGIPSFIPSHW